MSEKASSGDGSSASAAKCDITSTTVVDAITTLYEGLDQSLKITQDKIKSSSDVENSIKALGRAIGLYTECFKKLDVKFRVELEALFQKYFRYSDIQDGVEDLLDVENSWNKFLKDMDDEAAAEQVGDFLKEGDPAPADLEFIDARSGDKVKLGQLMEHKQPILLICLRHYAWLPWRDHIQQVRLAREQLASANALVVVVAHGDAKGAERWLKENECDYMMLRDPERKLYTASRMRLSFYRTWQTQVMLYYAEQKASNRTLTPPFEGDILHQMGGDLIIDPNGKMALVYASKSASDRPSITALLDILNAMK